MAIKLDLEKAYEKVSWDFICASLNVAGIPIFFQTVIMSAISSSSMQILWNGMPTQKFKPIRGIRQGCPLSPYLFVICMEWLGHIIRVEMDIGKWEPIRLSRTGPLSLIKRDYWITFLISSTSFRGTEFNVRKSNIFFSKVIGIDVRNQITQMFGFQEAQNLGTYFGVHFLHNRVTNNTLSFVVDKPWAREGLGFRHLSDQNTSFLMKIGFSLVSKSNMLWVRVLHSKYGWKEQFPDSISRNQCSHLRRESVNSDGSWNLDLLYVWLLEDVISRITSIPPPHLDYGSDRVIWARSALGVFSVHSAYWTLKEDTWNSQEEYWKSIWKYLGPQRVRVFLWLAFKQRILTNSERTRRGIDHSNSCTLCGHDFEDLGHVLRDCPSAKDIWMLVLPEQLTQRFFSVSFQDWLLLNLCFHERLQGSGLTWSCLFGLIAWRI
ncbi:uncharacterized protein [Gossypium hirsutum]|uniref:Reverse transcriptase domain-containing protein n=1 Tax=Gossypium hirsutum TaxID=3635 RepID=A0A1U8MZJ4_GOSHI|nr:uncharacterized protein LOC107943043 [Gossypium hirsutum]